MLATTAVAQEKDQDQFFQLPIVPDSISTLDGRTDYLLLHYWDFCDLKKAFSSKSRMAHSFKEFLDLAPYGNKRNVHKAVEDFLKKLEKRPDDLLFIAREAEANLYADTAEMLSDELFLPFAEAVSKNKKVDKAEKKHFQRIADILSRCQIGMIAPDFEYTTRDGEKRSFSADTADVVVVYFNDPDCSDCNMARLRLDADVQTTRLIEAGVMKIVAITPMAPDGQWRDLMQSYPQNWSVGACEGINDIYDIRNAPTFFLFDKQHKIYGKNMDINTLLTINSRLASRYLK